MRAREKTENQREKHKRNTEKITRKKLKFEKAILVS